MLSAKVQKKSWKHKNFNISKHLHFFINDVVKKQRGQKKQWVINVKKWPSTYLLRRKFGRKNSQTCWFMFYQLLQYVVKSNYIHCIIRLSSSKKKSKTEFFTFFRFVLPCGWRRSRQFVKKSRELHRQRKLHRF